MFRCRGFILAFGAAMLLAALSTTASAQRVARGILFTLGENLVTELTPAGDEDTFVFYGVTGANVSFTLQPLSDGLTPAMTLRDADDNVLDLSAHSRVNGAKTKVRDFPLPQTGAYFVQVTAPPGQTGQYRLKTKGDLTDVPGFPTMTIGPGETQDFVFGAGPGLAVEAKIKLMDRRKKVSVLSVYDPDSEELPHGAGGFYLRSTALVASLRLRSSARSSWRDDSDPRRLGQYGLTVGGATTTAEYKIKIRVRHVGGHGTRVIASTVPVITHLEPTFGRPGTAIVVHGANFLPGKIEVLFAGSYGREPTYLSPTTIAVRAPFGEGEVDITVINPDGQEGTLEDGFIFIPYPPNIEVVTPIEGPDGGGTVVDVIGERMTWVETVTLGSTAITGPLEIPVDWKLSFTTEPMAPGTYDIELTDRFGQTVGMESAFTFVAAPVLLSLSPDKGGGGRPVTCIGLNFRPDHVVLVDGVPIETTYLGPTALGWVTPPGTPGDEIQVGVRDIWGRTSTLPELFEYAYSYGVFDEPFSDSDLEDTDFTSTLGGLAKWNPVTDPGKLVSTFGADTVDVPDPHSKSVSTNVIPLGTGSFANMFNITWYKQSDVGNAGTISGFAFLSGSGSAAPNAVMTGFTVVIGHNTSSTGLTTSSPRTANFSGTPVTVISNVSYTLPSSVPSTTPIDYPTFS